jgi:acyl-coenzyme A thioesterase PaaI-like protein
MRMTPARYHYNPIGTVHGGILARFPHPAMGSPLPTLPNGRAYTSMEFRVNDLRAVTNDCGELSAGGQNRPRWRPLDRGRGESPRYQGGLPFATPSTTCLMFDLPAV